MGFAFAQSVTVASPLQLTPHTLHALSHQACRVNRVRDSCCRKQHRSSVQVHWKWPKYLQEAHANGRNARPNCERDVYVAQHDTCAPVRREDRVRAQDPLDTAQAHAGHDETQNDLLIRSGESKRHRKQACAPDPRPQPRNCEHGVYPLPNTHGCFGACCSVARWVGGWALLGFHGLVVENVFHGCLLRPMNPSRARAVNKSHCTATT